MQQCTFSTIRPQCATARNHTPIPNMPPLPPLRAPQRAHILQRLPPIARTTTLVCSAAAAPPEQLQVEETTLPGCVVHLKVSVPPSTCQRHYDNVLQELQQQVTLPGFRKTSSKKGGKKKGGAGSNATPMTMLINAAGGQQAVNANAIERLLHEALPQALKRYENVALADSERIVTDVESLIDSFGVKKALEFVVEVQVAPSVTWKGPYTGLTVEVEDAGGEEAVASQVEARLAKEQKDSAQMRVVTGRGVGAGDVAIVDAKVQLERGGKLEVVSDRSKMRMDMDTADEEFLPGVAAALKDMVVGESRTVSLTVPDDFGMAALRGQQVQVDVTLHELFCWDMPELNDAWANKRFPGCSLAKVRDLLSTSFRKQQQQEMTRKINAALSSKVGELAECEIPDKLVLDFGETEYQARLLEAHGKGLMTFEQMEALATEEALARFVHGQREELVAAVREVAAIEAIFKEQGLSVPKEAMEAEYAAAVAQFRQQGQEFDEDKLTEQVEETLKARTVLEWLGENNNVVVTPAKGNP